MNKLRHCHKICNLTHQRITLSGRRTSVRRYA